METVPRIGPENYYKGALLEINLLEKRLIIRITSDLKVLVRKIGGNVWYVHKQLDNQGYQAALHKITLLVYTRKASLMLGKGILGSRKKRKRVVNSSTFSASGNLNLLAS